MGSALCCCKGDHSNPEERQPLKTTNVFSVNTKKFTHPDEEPLSSSLLASAKPNEPLFEPSIEDIINQISSGDDEDLMDPSQEAKYEQILKGIED